jgi:hypothetical protein
LATRAFGQAVATTRFATADLSGPDAIDLGRGPLSVCACDLVVADARTTALTLVHRPGMYATVAASG